MIYQVRVRFQGGTWQPHVDGVLDPVTFKMIFDRSAEPISTWSSDAIQDLLVLWCNANDWCVRRQPIWIGPELCLTVELEIGSVAEYTAMGFDAKTAGELARKAQDIRRDRRLLREVRL